MRSLWFQVSVEDLRRMLFIWADRYVATTAGDAEHDLAERMLLVVAGEMRQAEYAAEMAAKEAAEVAAKAAAAPPVEEAAE